MATFWRLPVVKTVIRRSISSDTRTKASHRLTVNQGGDLSPTWSPTGREMAFTSDRGGAPQIFIISADGVQCASTDL